MPTPLQTGGGERIPVRYRDSHGTTKSEGILEIMHKGPQKR
jgi:hypothetical protein